MKKIGTMVGVIAIVLFLIFILVMSSAPNDSKQEAPKYPQKSLMIQKLLEKDVAIAGISARLDTCGTELGAIGQTGCEDQG
jgi:hypothetical protein